MSNLRKGIIILVLLVITIRLAGSTTPASAQPSLAPSSVSDDFSSNDIGNYNILSGSWSITNGQLVGDGAISRLICTPCSAGQSLNEFYTTLQVFVPATISDPWSSISLTLYGQDTNQRMYFALLPSPSNAYVEFIRDNAGTQTTYYPKPVTSTGGQWYTLKALWRNAKIWSKVWPTSAAEPAMWQIGYIFNNVDFHPFSVGIRTYGLTGLQFDNFSVTQISAGTQRSAIAQGTYFPETKNTVPPPSYNSAILPQPVIDGDPGLVSLYNGAWQILYNGHIRQPVSTSPLVRTFLDTAFDPNIMFQWDTLFMTMFGRYIPPSSFDSIGSLDNWYRLEKDTGYIDRVYYEDSGQPHPWGNYPDDINPPLFAWAELQSYTMTGDLSRIQRVLPPLQAYADYVSIEHWSMTTTHGLYWNDTYGNGMDNINLWGSGWADMSAQMVLMYKNLAQLYTLIGDSTRASENQTLANGIAARMNQYMWNTSAGVYYNVNDDGSQNASSTIGTFWALIAGVSNATQTSQLVGNLANTGKYYTDIPFASTPKNESTYHPDGNYWHGGAWAPTNFMVIKGLDVNGQSVFASQAAQRYLDAMLQIYQNSGTIWEVLAPEQQTGKYVTNSYAGNGNGGGTPAVKAGVTLNPTSLYYSPATTAGSCALNSGGGSSCLGVPNFVGWSGVGPIALLIEDVIGININTPSNQITWNLTRIDRHGVQNLTLGNKGTVSLVATARSNASCPITITANSTVGNTLSLVVNTSGQIFTQTINANANNQSITIPLSGNCSSNQAAGTYDDQNYSAFMYTGSGWSHDGGGCVPGCYNSTNSWDNTINDTATIAFSGTQIKFYGVKDPGHGIGGVSIDGGGEVSVDFYAATRAGNQLLWTSPTLSSGPHTFKLRVTGNKNPSSANSWVVPDRVDVVDGSFSTTAWYNVINQNSNKCIDAAGMGTSNGTKVIQWTCGTGTNQQWQFQSVGSGYYKVQPRYSSAVVWEVTGGPGATGDNAPIQLWNYLGGVNQQWQPVALGGGYYKFVAQNSGKCLEVPAWSTADGTQLTQYPCNGGANQSFRLVQQP